MIPGKIKLACMLIVPYLTKVLYMRRLTPLGIHTQAIIQLLRLELESSHQDQQIIMLIRAAAPRILARHILCREHILGRTVRLLAEFAQDSFESRITRFIADACDVLNLLKREQNELEGEHVRRTQSVADLTELLYNLLQEMEAWLEQHGTSTKPRRVSLRLLQNTDWPLPSARTTVLVFDNIRAARGWILFHMCCIRSFDVLVESQTAYLPYAGRDHLPTARQSTPRIWQSRASLNESSHFLLDIAPFLIGLTDKDGNETTSPLHDTGLLIVQYPLWTIEQSSFVPVDAKLEASVLLSFIEKQRSVVRQLS